MSRRGVAPVVGVAVLVVVTLVLAAVVGAFVIGLGGGTDHTPTAAITADRNGNEVVLTHVGGDSLDVNDLTVRLFVDGRALDHQPRVPAAGMVGFRGAPSGPFNSRSDDTWSAGEVASVTIATTTNAPQPTAGSTVTVRISVDGEAVATART
ncbi:type IV pilin N-terminal domain-containing protein [Halococcus sp. IIIV-5B]|uniref:type IV pilin N-terminal domain-containing protein n=1 Tax=Halococcus sp. IIIV-5B TaxID=2321230 RepID=UPI000E7706BE|nr:type IV pilin N-terminal domain-containing protein [Halococcus sp. IIIV-5B]RJT00796.1 type IV pilin [Halococcus sp. IIIV-5B]